MVWQSTRHICPNFYVDTVFEDVSVFVLMRHLKASLLMTSFSSQLGFLVTVNTPS